MGNATMTSTAGRALPVGQGTPIGRRAAWIFVAALAVAAAVSGGALSVRAMNTRTDRGPFAVNETVPTAFGAVAVEAASTLGGPTQRGYGFRSAGIPKSGPPVFPEGDKPLTGRSELPVRQSKAVV